MLLDSLENFDRQWFKVGSRYLSDDEIIAQYHQFKYSEVYRIMLSVKWKLLQQIMENQKNVK
jgi:hypothetical protein